MIYRCFSEVSPNETLLHKWYKKDPQLYNYFIERYSILIEMRFNLSAAFAINFLVNIVYLTFTSPIQNKPLIILLEIIYALSSFFLYKLSVITEEDYKEKIKNFMDHPIEQIW